MLKSFGLKDIYFRLLMMKTMKIKNRKHFYLKYNKTKNENILSNFLI